MSAGTKQMFIPRVWNRQSGYSDFVELFASEQESLKRIFDQHAKTVETHKKLGENTTADHWLDQVTEVVKTFETLYTNGKTPDENVLKNVKYFLSLVSDEQTRLNDERKVAHQKKQSDRVAQLDAMDALLKEETPVELEVPVEPKKSRCRIELPDCFIQ